MNIAAKFIFAWTCNSETIQCAFWYPCVWDFKENSSLTLDLWTCIKRVKLHICSVASWENVSSRKPLKTVEEISYLCSCGVRGVGGMCMVAPMLFRASAWCSYMRAFNIQRTVCCLMHRQDSTGTKERASSHYISSTCWMHRLLHVHRRRRNNTDSSSIAHEKIRAV